MPAILKHFSVPGISTLANLVAGRDRAYKQGGKGKTVGAPAALDWLLDKVTIPENLTDTLSNLGLKPPFNDSANFLEGKTMDYVVEALFIGMVRAFWHRIPSYRHNGEYVTNLSSVCPEPEIVRSSWDAGRLRLPNRVSTIMNYFRKATKVDYKDHEDLWGLTYLQLFGSLERGKWMDLPNKSYMKKLGYYPYWAQLMESHSRTDRVNIYQLMRRKFDTLCAFPRLDNTRGWAVTRDSSIKILANPKVADCNHYAGYRSAHILNIPDRKPKVYGGFYVEAF
ncbi:hypothetical protein CPB86DRAFT_803047 [Serendipita vermifera]|nr:hypothetical protein CPB86DRAFT_803047 [Serendipita vermifera]